MSTRLSKPGARASAARWLAVLSLECVAITLLTIAAAYYQFGRPCFERHDTLCQCLIYIAINSGASVIGLALRRTRRTA
ncbi:hypothetical protein DIE23_23085 [Burkholderia sp. Bp9143]|uniref:hypothetical protein n=1 Tax=Burkholderia sp. Bp9143 TaxID=2184574 RepID=UPI000F593372|nr:hypothetical protein [Burkholderia sp. Bp9143]RQR28834.1 hypothetical protein DIE23_23085 [Burkholderia sp. Bp9143]